MNFKISLIIPVFNEAKEIENFFNELKKLNFDLINEIIFIDDCSTDNSYDLLKQQIKNFKIEKTNVNFNLLDNLKNRGYGFSIKKGVENSTNQVIGIIDLDRTYKIEDLNEISEQFVNIYKLKYDLIIGQRTIDISNTSKLKIVGKKIINAITNFCFNEKIIDYNSGLRIFDKNKFIKHEHMMSNRFSLTTSMTITFLNENYDIKFHKISYNHRSGQSKLKYYDFFKFLYTIFSLLFYYRPFKTLIPIILPLFLIFIFFLIKDIRLGNITDKTVLLFNSNFLLIILFFIIDRINKFK
ncbi:glycosyltransferase family 2 protein [Candidatus Pelagibacter sp. HIMB1587]|uniref:glycosyltransferase family 2 protein n=1 Tax=Candidatus Pelagibacter sp. HIMB1587 TaxID=3413354 RepID=UPI003F828290